MKVFVSQIYIEAGANYPFSCLFQRFLSEELTRRVEPSRQFLEKYENNFNVVFNMSAKSSIAAPEVKGPTVFKEDKDVEYSIFLPYKKGEALDEKRYREVLALLLQEIEGVLGSLGMEVNGLREDANDIIDRIVKNPAMFGH